MSPVLQDLNTDNGENEKRPECRAHWSVPAGRINRHFPAAPAGLLLWQVQRSNWPAWREMDCVSPSWHLNAFHGSSISALTQIELVKSAAVICHLRWWSRLPSVLMSPCAIRNTFFSCLSGCVCGRANPGIKPRVDWIICCQAGLVAENVLTGGFLEGFYNSRHWCVWCGVRNSVWGWGS